MLEPQLSNFDIDFFIFRIALSIMRPKFPEFEGGQNVAGKFGIDHNESEKMWNSMKLDVIIILLL